MPGHKLQFLDGVGHDMKEIGHRALKAYMLHFPVTKGKGRLMSLLWKPLSSGRYIRETALRQADVRLCCDLTMTLQRHLYFFGGYEEENCEYWMKLAGRARTVFDIGANVGLYSLLAAAVNPCCQVHAFEPTSEVVDILMTNIRLNKFQNIVVRPVAVGDVSGHGFLHRRSGADGSSEGMNFVTRIRREDSDAPVAMLSLDDYCRDNGIEQIDLMKLDIEGGEHDALLGAQRLLRAKAIESIFLELVEWAAERSGHSTAQVKRLLVDAGYHIYRLHSGKLVPLELGTVTPGENVVAFRCPPEESGV